MTAGRTTSNIFLSSSFHLLFLLSFCLPFFLFLTVTTTKTSYAEVEKVAQGLPCLNNVRSTWPSSEGREGCVCGGEGHRNLWGLGLVGHWCNHTGETGGELGVQIPATAGPAQGLWLGLSLQ